ncbi:AMP-binding protein [Rhodococcus hoagii]|nr:AMP-binding protein [Prescottella equi]
MRCTHRRDDRRGRREPAVARRMGRRRCVRHRCPGRAGNSPRRRGLRGVHLGHDGHPKAVVLTARGLGAFGDDLAEIFAADADSRVLHVAGPGFDMALLEMLLAGMSGARLVVAPGSAYGGPELTELIAAERVTHACLTPSVASSVAAGSFRTLRR